MTAVPLADPAVVVLAGAVGLGQVRLGGDPVPFGGDRFLGRAAGIVGSGPADLDASAEAFALLDQIAAARTRRRLTTVIDTLGLDPDRRNDYLRLARSADLPAVLVIMDTPPALCRQRNRQRDRPVPAPVITEQLRRVKNLITTADDEGWDQVVIIAGPADSPAPAGPPPEVDR